MTTTAALERCAVCGGEFSTKRVHIDGKPYHHGCAVMSYPPHTPDDMARAWEEVEKLRKLLERMHDWASASNDWRPDSRLARDVRAAAR